MNRTNIKVQIAIGAPIILCLLWLFTAMWISHRAFIRKDAPDAMIVITIAAFIGLFCAWRYVMRGESALFSGESLFTTFFWVFIGATLVLWYTPEAWVHMAAREVITREEPFTVNHPGPRIGRFSSCSAGLHFYDDWLKRSVELCTRDEYVPSGAKSVEIEKRVIAHGARFVRYRFISADGVRHDWVKV